MRPHRIFSIFIAAGLTLTTVPAFADTTDMEKFDPMRMWECPQADGSSVYTNKERAGCKLMDLKPLSIVPSLDHMPTYRPSPVTAPHYEIPGYAERAQADGGQGTNVPDWAKDWHASVASSGSVQSEVCTLYGEWLELNQKTRGGIFYGSDPSYGGDISGQNRRGASYSFYDNTRYLALSRLFGQGFVPIGCQ